MTRYDFQIIYKPGKSNRVADALSRKNTSAPPLLLAVSSPLSLIFKELQQFYSTNEGHKLIQSCTQDQPLSNLFSTRQGLLFFGHQIFFPSSQDFRHHIPRDMHESPSTGHSGLQPTLACVATSFYWLGWTRDVKTPSTVYHLLTQQILVKQTTWVNATLINPNPSMGRFI